MSRTVSSQSLDSKANRRLVELADRLGIQRSRVLAELLSTPHPELLVEIVRRPAIAKARLETIETLEQGQIIGQAVVRYLETRDALLKKGNK